MLGDGIVLTSCFFPQQQNTRGKYAFLIYYSIYVFPYFEMWYNDTKPSTFRVFSLTWPVSMQDKVIETTTTKKHLRAERVQLSQHLFGTPIWPPHVMWNLFPPQRLPLGIPIKIAIIRKNRKRAGSDGKREKARSVFLSRQPSRNSKMPLRRREMWNHGIRLSICLFVFIAPRTR